MTDPLLPPETFSDAMDAEDPTLHSDRPGPDFIVTARWHGRPQYKAIPTIDLDLPPVDAAPKPKGPRARLQMLREWSEETCPPGPRRRAKGARP